LFIINGLTLSIGILYISQNLKKTKTTQLATAFILILALGNIVSGFIPADINLFWHSIFAQLGMVTVLAGLWMYASSLTNGKYWTYGCLVSLLVILILIMFVFFCSYAYRSAAKIILFSNLYMGHRAFFYVKQIIYHHRTMLNYSS
jgi:large-conductance mechanosensitive channel